MVPILDAWYLSINLEFVFKEIEFWYGFGNSDMVWKYHFLSCSDVGLA